VNTWRQLPVPAALRGWVDGIDLPSDRAGSCPLIHVPDPATTIVWRVRADGDAAVLAAGPRTHATYYDAKDIPRCVRFRLAPGAGRSLLGTSIDEITDRVVPLDGLWGPLDPRRVDHVIAGLSARVEAASSRDRSTAHLVRRASIALGRSRVPEVARQVGVSERHLRDVFARTVGVAPQQFFRINRVRAVLPRLRRDPWAGLADSVGFYDQSHMISQFRAVMHVTPSAFAAGRLPTVAC
jgi:AraC-like DNA-binding protein